MPQYEAQTTRFAGPPLSPTSIPAPTHCPFQTPKPGRGETLLIDRQPNQNHGESQGQLACRAISVFRHAPSLGTQGPIESVACPDSPLGVSPPAARGQPGPIDSPRAPRAEFLPPASETNVSISGLRRCRLAQEPCRPLSNPEGATAEMRIQKTKKRKEEPACQENDWRTM
ncbi:hypothetical protein LY76DRAFT_271717 [Colletotrichum caudatum]|nr:hypothetical protein LY76DRAFT_271717 [Colletotrichum caudatum]